MGHHRFKYVGAREVGSGPANVAAHGKCLDLWHDGIMRVSVVIPVFNGERYLRAALLSAMEQTYAAAEIIVVDDGSTDDSMKVIDAVNQMGTLTVVRQSNMGLAAARNSGIEVAQGELVAFLDADDVWFPEKLAAQVPLFEDASVGAVGSFMTYLGPTDRPFGTSGEIADERGEDIAAARFKPFAPSSTICRRKVLLDTGGFDPELSRLGVEDLDSLARIASSYRVLTVPRPLGYYRVHPDSVTFDRFYEMQRATEFLQDRIRDRRSGQDITWAEWTAGHPITVQNRRQWRTRFLYRRAGLYWVSERRGRGIGCMAIAALMGPRYVVPRVRRQFRTVGQLPSEALVD